MKEVPNIISSKDLIHINEILKINYLLLKKITLFNNIVANDNVKKYLNKLYNFHKLQYKTLLDILS